MGIYLVTAYPYIGDRSCAGPALMFSGFRVGDQPCGAYRYVLVTGPAVMYISILMTGPCSDHIETQVPAVMAPPGGAREPALAIK